jgi:hypothetical protein
MSLFCWTVLKTCYTPTVRFSSIPIPTVWYTPSLSTVWTTPNLPLSGPLLTYPLSGPLLTYPLSGPIIYAAVDLRLLINHVLENRHMRYESHLPRFKKKVISLLIFTRFPVVRWQFIWFNNTFFLNRDTQRSPETKNNNNRDLIYYARIYIVYVSFTCIIMHACI